ncbi:CG18478 [Drosophila busckii]|uniref:Phenoloxidase-activating factor 2 n=1 Tax=Drosophila busckii TaxID=30019 RepID=A0A0M4EBE0_DROBS|nr:CG18478 [Drosophila busckii]
MMIIILYRMAKQEKSCGLNKVCSERYLCDDDNNIIQDGHGLINYRQAVFAEKDNGGCVLPQVCCTLPQQPKPLHVEQPTPEGCGYSNPKGLQLTLVETTNEAQFAEFPWVVMILEQIDSISSRSIGGGSLLAPTVVLTAAHIVDSKDVSHLTIRAGEWNTVNEAEPRPHVNRQVSKRIIHPAFNWLNSNYDAALLLLRIPLKLGANIGTVCLPPPAAQFSNQRCLVMGWGKKRNRDLWYPNILKKISLPIVAADQCQSMLRNTQLGQFFNLHESLLCAGGEKDKDACLGDGGGPLVCSLPNQPDRYQLAGLVAWGMGCGVENVPGVYASVPKLRDWIDEQFHLNRISKEFYTA